MWYLRRLNCPGMLGLTILVLVLVAYLTEDKMATDQILSEAVFPENLRGPQVEGIGNMRTPNLSPTFVYYDDLGVYTYHNVCIEAAEVTKTIPRITVYRSRKNLSLILPVRATLTAADNANSKWPIHYSTLDIPMGYRIISDYAAFFTQHAGLENLYHLFMDLFRLQFPVLVSTHALDNPTANRFIYR